MSFLRFIAASSIVVACGSDSTTQPLDAGTQDAFGHKNFDAQTTYDASEADAPKVAWDRMTNHGAGALGAPHIRAIYVGTEGVDQSPSFDDYMTFLVSSPDWWGAILSQYGVSTGTYDGATVIPTSTFIHAGDVNSQGFINWGILDMRVQQAIHATLLDDAGVDSGTPQVPHADAYVVYLPDGVNVDLGQGQTTCANAGGYHSYDTDEPYAIIPPCGRYRIVISHEIAEMVTDPEPGSGWYSDADEQTMYGGEIGDLCNQLTYVDGQQVTRLWSNKDGDCEPPQ